MSNHRTRANAQNKSISVAPLRKQALLLEARRNRVEWVEAAAWPQQRQHSRVDTSQSQSQQRVASQDEDDLALLRSSRVCESMKSVVDVVSNLYGAEDVKDRVVKQLLAQVSSGEAKRILGQKLVEEDEAVANDVVSVSAKNSLLLSSSSMDDSNYNSFIQRLRSPESAELVQGMRHFVACFDDAAKMSIEKKVSRIERDQQLRDVGAVYAKDLENSNDNSDFVGMQAENEDAKAAAGTIHAYLNLAYQSLKSHVLWKKDIMTLQQKEKVVGVYDDAGSSPNVVAASLETFIYQKIYECCWDMACSQEKDDEFRHMVDSLQFVSWKHLDLDCLSTQMIQSKSTEGENRNIEESSDSDGYKSDFFPVPDSLWKPILSNICSIDSHWSPTAKIQEMNKILKDITNALRTLARDNNNSDKLPGADDILPMLILAIIKAKPSKLYSNLLFTQYYASPGQLRGEGGYVLTQFQSAIHFVLGVDAASLTIDSSEFEKELEKCKQDIVNRKTLAQGSPRKSISTETKTSKNDNDDENKFDDDELKTLHEEYMIQDIPIANIREAWEDRAVIDLEWTKQWHKQNSQSGTNIESQGFLSPAGPVDIPSPTKSRAGSRASSPNKSIKTSLVARSSPFSNALPPGFSRNYSFLGVQPNDIKFSDVPKLLEEYQQLVRACETMLKERSALASAEHKLKVKLVRDHLESSVIAMDERKDTEESFNSILDELRIEPSFSVETDGGAHFVATPDNASV